MRQVADAVCTTLVYSLIIVALGCAGSSQDDLQAFIAVTGNYGLVQTDAPPPPPAPEPESDKCETCRGTGKADGRVTCPVCGGTGKKTQKASVVVHPVPSICPTGTCSTPRIVR